MSKKIEIVFKPRQDPVVDIALPFSISSEISVPQEFDIDNYYEAIVYENERIASFVCKYDIPTSNYEDLEKKIKFYSNQNTTLFIREVELNKTVNFLTSRNKILEEKVKFLEENLWS